MRNACVVVAAEVDHSKISFQLLGIEYAAPFLTNQSAARLDLRITSAPYL